MTLIICKVCEANIPMARTGQRFCSPVCRQAAFRQRTAKKATPGVTQKRRLYPVARKRHESSDFPNKNKGEFTPPTQYFYNIGYGSAGKPLSDVEIAALGGYVANIARPHAVGGDSQ